MAKALSFPHHKHPPSTRDPKFMLRFGAFSNDQGSEGDTVSPNSDAASETPDSEPDGSPESADPPEDGLPSPE